VVESLDHNCCRLEELDEIAQVARVLEQHVVGFVLRSCPPAVVPVGLAGGIELGVYSTTVVVESSSPCLLLLD